MTADITLRGPGDVVAVLPYQLGYHPRDSVVLVTLHGRRVGLVARADLPPDGQVGEVLASLTGPLLREGAGSVIVVVDVAVVRDGRRYSPICSEPCCPPEGVALPHPADVPGVVELVGLGRAPLRSRSDVEGLVVPEPSQCLGVAAALEARDRMPRRRRRAAAAWRVVLTEGERGTTPPHPRVVADLALGLADVPWRDALIAWLAPSVLPADALDGRVLALMRSSLPRWAGMGLEEDGRDLGWVGEKRGGAGDVADRSGEEPAGALAAERQELLRRLLSLCRSVPDECPVEAAALCTVAAHVAWVGGDGAIARAAVERALRLAPGYRLAELLQRLVDNAIRLPSGAVSPGRRERMDEAG
jgi:hypothetical protein